MPLKPVLNLVDFPSEQHKFLENYLKDQLVAQEENSKHSPLASLFALDETKKLIGIICVACSTDVEYAFTGNGKHKLQVAYQKRLLWENPYTDVVLTIDFFWLVKPPVITALSAKCHGQPILFHVGNGKHLFLRGVHLTKQNARLTLVQRILAKFFTLGYFKRKFKGCWLLIDRDYKADDNAEHLYRWIMRNHPEKKIFFSLRKDSPDWSRLKAEGFNLLPFNFFWYFAAYLHCSWLISSNLTGHITKRNWKRIYAGIVRNQFCFLQHGITKDYQPTLNRLYSDMLLTAAKGEYESFAKSSEYPYIFCEKEVQLTGFPRYDALLEKAQKIHKPGTILIMPTWRQKLAGRMIPGTSRYEYAPAFKHSDFFKEWQKVLQSKTLRTLAETCNLRVCFFPHPYLRQQMSDFTIPEHVTVLNDTGGSIQDTLADTALLITDYSSIAFDAAIIRRPVIYYQFDKDSFFSGDHAYMSGYFDYDKDGFGETPKNMQEFEDALDRIIQNKCELDPVYQERCEAFFAYSDANNCQRVFEALMQSSKPYEA